MTDFTINIPENKFSSELRNNLYRLSNQDIKFKSILQLANCEVNDNSLKELINQIDNSIFTFQYKNKEITARINDIKFILNDKDKIESIKIAIENYFEIYNATLHLYRKIESIFL